LIWVFKNSKIFTNLNWYHQRADFFVGQMQEKDLRRLAEQFFRLPQGSLKADSSGIKFGEDDLVGGQITGVPKDPFEAADIHECDRRLDELRGERGIF